jgi:hypothetical protein
MKHNLAVEEESMPRKCVLCNHERRQEIDHALLCGDSQRVIAHNFAVSRGAVARHLDHMSSALAQARELQQVAQGDSLLAQLRELALEARRLKLKAEQLGDYRAALGAVRELARLLELEARLTGALDQRPTTKILNLTLDAETARRMTETFLARHQTGGPA